MYVCMCVCICALRVCSTRRMRGIYCRNTLNILFECVRDQRGYRERREVESHRGWCAVCGAVGWYTSCRWCHVRARSAFACERYLLNTMWLLPVVIDETAPRIVATPCSISVVRERSVFLPCNIITYADHRQWIVRFSAQPSTRWSHESCNSFLIVIS